MATRSPRSMGMLIVLLLMVSLVSLKVFVLPSLKEAKADNVTEKSKLTGLEMDISALTAARSELATSKANLEQEGVSFDDLATHIPKTEQLPDLYRQVQRTLSEAKGLGAVAYQIAQPSIEPATGLARIPFTVTASGTYADLKTFASMLTVDTRPLSISQITFTNAAKAGSEEKYTMSVTGTFAAQGVSSSFTTVTK